jgi:hypothetical protein
VVDPNFSPWPDMASIFDTGPIHIPAPTFPDSPTPPMATPKLSPAGYPCPRCSIVNPNQQRFCLSCGQRLKIDCFKCHTENSIEAVICSHCQSNLKQQQVMRQELGEARHQARRQWAQSVKEKEAQQFRDKIHDLFSDLVIRSKRTGALNQLNQLDQRKLGLLREVLLSSREVEARLMTARLFGQIASRSDIKAAIRQVALVGLIDAVEDPEPVVRQLAQELLQKIGARRNRDVSELFNGVLDRLQPD